MCRVTTEHMWKHRIDTETLEDRVGLRSLECYLSKRRLQWAGAVMRMDWEVRLPRKLMSSWVYHQRPNGGPLMHFGRNLKRDLLRIELNLDPPPVVFPDAVRVSDRQRNKIRSHWQHRTAIEGEGSEAVTNTNRGITTGTVLGGADGE